MGSHITRDREARELKLDQHLYVKSMVERPMSNFPYRGAVGAPMWTSTMTRPDIACAVRTMARFCKIPGLAHKRVVLKVMQYISHTKESSITYGGRGCGLNMEAFTDSDFGA